MTCWLCLLQAQQPEKVGRHVCDSDHDDDDGGDGDGDVDDDDDSLLMTLLRTLR